jgi:putative hydrolase of the HAD superfamily
LPAYQAVISDLGGVVVELDFVPLKQFLGQRANIPSEKAWEVMVREGSWMAYEVGAIETDDYVARVAETLACTLTTEEFLDGWCRLFPGLCEGIEELYEETVAQGLQLLALSNTNAGHLPYLRERFPVMSRFEPLYASHEIRARKPDAAAFRHVLDDTGLPAEGCIFIDDQPENIAAAQELGMATILAEGTESIRRGLELLEVLPPRTQSR